MSNYCFNYDKFNKWEIIDCHLECPAYSENKSNEEYLIDFALWVGGDLVGGSRGSFKESINNINPEILEFITNKIRFLWCSDVKVKTLEPLQFLKPIISEVSNINVNAIYYYQEAINLHKIYRTVNFDKKSGSLSLKI